jgi:hypothetical protein
MKSIDLKMTSVEVKTQTMPLRAQWTRELATDLQSMKEWNDIARTSSRKSKVCKIYES